MTAALELAPHQRALEVDTGSGYAAPVLSRVYTIEATPNVHVRHGDGTLGWPEHAPYDAIVVAAGGRDAPEPLLAQLAIGGRLVIPIWATPA